MGSLRFVPAEGQWIALAVWPTIVTVPAGIADETVETIWSTLGLQGVTLERVVSSIPLRGTDAVRDFSVLRLDPGADASEPVPDAGSENPDTSTWRATVVTRGAAVVDLLSVGGSRRFASSGIEPWALAEFSDIIGVSTGSLPEAPEAVLRIPPDARRLDHGVAAASRVVWASAPDLLTTGPAPASRVAQEGSGENASESHDDHDAAAAADDTVITRTRPGVGAGTVIPSPEDDPDPAHPDPQHPDSAHPTPAHPAFDLRVNDGPPIDLVGAVVFGRDPRARRSPTALPQTLVRVDSPGLRVSGTHVEIARSGRTVVVTDLRSSNGTTVVLPGRPPIRLRQGDSVVATGAAIVEIGDGNVIHISPRDRGNSGITV
ncbi:FHA domain-containing protein [Herbiconiux solani]|uniref:FHA domain-containing protein n=1 Tax=Herbiconiux solani TaxID=661329 RepID=UPI0008250742|nr:FHA domain-containing protein [Herbiconiux solani]